MAMFIFKIIFKIQMQSHLVVVLWTEAIKAIDMKTSNTEPPSGSFLN